MAYQANGLTYVGLSSHRGPSEWHIRMHGAFKVPYDTLGIRRDDKYQRPSLRKNHGKENRQF